MPIIRSGLSRLAAHRILMLALASSIVFHLLIFSEFSFYLPVEDERVVLEARLVSAPPPVKLQAATTKKPVPRQSRASRPTKKTMASPQPQSEWVASSESTSTPASPSNGTASISEQGTETTRSAAPIEESAADLAAPVPYTHVEIWYEVRRNGGSAAGTTRVTFNMDPQQKTYSLLSHTQAKGLASLFFGNLIQKSEGTVDTSGLKPNFYSYQYGNDPKKQQTAAFKWETHQLELHNARGNSTETLMDGTQDFLSFMYQFMFSPPLDSMQITMTNGKRLRRYYYSFEGEEIVHSTLGDLNTTHLLKSSGDEEKTEIWLAIDYRYLPVKIVKTEKDGTVIEQVVTQLKTMP